MVSAIATFKEMELSCLAPDGVDTRGASECMYSWQGLVDEGRACFESMSQDYRTEPQIEHREIKKKKKKTYLCKDKMSLDMFLGCIYIHILITCLY